MNIKDFKWTREPDDYTLTDDKIEIITQPGTDLWQRTYYHFRNDNAPVSDSFASPMIGRI